MADVLWTNTFAAVGRTVLGVARRIGDDPCSLIDIWFEDKERFVLEHVRMDPPVEMISVVKEGVRAGVSITAANRDSRVFKNADQFNSKRGDLLDQFSWNALESEIRGGGAVAGVGSTMMRVCPAHDYSIVMTMALVDALLPSGEDMDNVCHDIYHEYLFDWLVMFVNCTGGVLGGLYIFFAMRTSWLRIVIRKHCSEEVAVKEREGAANIIVSSRAVAGSSKKVIRGRRRSVHASKLSQEGGLLELSDVRASVVKVGKGGKGFESHLLDGVNVSFKPGCLTAVMGGSGAGKSTLLNVASLRQSDEISLRGSVTFGGETVESAEAMSDFVRAVGFVPQELDVVVDENLSCAENLYFQAHLRWNKRTLVDIEEATRGDGSIAELTLFVGEGISAVAHAVTQMLDRFGLLPFANTTAKNLSGGQRRRLAISIECLRPAPIMFLDEPTTGQDASTALGIVSLLQELAKGCDVLKPKTIVMVIHQPREEIFSMIDRVVLLGKGGHVVFSGETDKALDQLVVDATAQSPLEQRKEGGLLSVGDHSGNLADQLMDVLQLLTAEQILRAAEIVRTREMKRVLARMDFRAMTKSSDPGSTKNPMRGASAESLDSGAWEGAGSNEMAPLMHRLNAMFLKRHWGTNWVELVMAWFVLPVTMFGICALPNWWVGGQPEAQELIVQVRAASERRATCSEVVFARPALQRLIRTCTSLVFHLPTL